MSFLNHGLLGKAARRDDHLPRCVFNFSLAYGLTHPVLILMMLGCRAE